MRSWSAPARWPRRRAESGRRRRPTPTPPAPTTICGARSASPLRPKSSSSRGAMIDPAHPVFEAGALLLTTDAGKTLLASGLPAATTVISLGSGIAVDPIAAVGVARSRPPADPPRGRPARDRLVPRGGRCRRALPHRLPASDRPLNARHAAGARRGGRPAAPGCRAIARRSSRGRRRPFLRYGILPR